MIKVNRFISVLLITLLIIGNSFTVFADTDSLDNYEIVEYIESSGTQYIDTGISPSTYYPNLVIEAEMSYSVVPTGSSVQSYLFGTGTYSSSSSGRYNIICGYRGDTTTSNFVMLSGAALSNARNTQVSLDTNKHTFVIDSINGTYEIDDTVLNYTVSRYQISNNLLIFAARQTSTYGAPIGYFSSARLYSFKIYNGSSLIRDFIPVKRKADNEYGLYDQIGDVFYTNQGNGSFNGGLSSYAVNVSVNPSGSGTVTGGGSYVQGTYCTLEAIPTGNYSFVSWSDGSVANPYTFIVNNTVNITANFTLPVQTFTVTTSVNPSGSGTVTGAGTYNEGETVELIATPSEGYVFKEWSDGVMYSTRYMILHDNVNLVAYFEEEQSEYTVTLNVYPENSGTVTGAGTYEAGEEIEIEAIPEEGYEFVSWSDGNIANPRTLSVNSTINLTASFKEESTPIDNSEELTLIVLLISFLILLNFGKGVNYD